jgi:hypothetical protein
MCKWIVYWTFFLEWHMIWNKFCNIRKSNRTSSTFAFIISLFVCLFVCSFACLFVRSFFKCKIRISPFLLRSTFHLTEQRMLQTRNFVCVAKSNIQFFVVRCEIKHSCFVADYIFNEIWLMGLWSFFFCSYLEWWVLGLVWTTPYTFLQYLLFLY